MEIYQPGFKAGYDQDGHKLIDLTARPYDNPAAMEIKVQPPEYPDV